MEQYKLISMNFFKIKITIVSVVLAFISFSAQAQTSAPVPTPKEAFEYSEMAKNRTYIGGPEESNLKLLPESHFQKNKKTTSTEETSEGF
jgi:hypothetical protein